MRKIDQEQKKWIMERIRRVSTYQGREIVFVSELEEILNQAVLYKKDLQIPLLPPTYKQNL